MSKILNLSRVATPFRVNVPPAQAFAHPGWLAARLGACDALRQGRSVLLIGLPGTGKTLLLHVLAGSLREEGFAARFVERGDALEVRQEDAILLVDEATSLQPDALESLLRRPSPCILAVLPGFAERIAPLDDAFVPVVLEPLGPEEVTRYVIAVLAAAGQRTDLFEPDAILALAQSSHGLLRVVNSLAGSAIFLAETEAAVRVARRHVDEANFLRHGMVDEGTPAPDGPDRTATPPEPAAAPSPPDGSQSAAREASPGEGAPTPSPASPPMVEAAVSARQEVSDASSADPARSIGAPLSPVTPVAPRRAVPRADALARPAASTSGRAMNRRAIRQARRLTVIAAGLALALSVGLLMSWTPSASGPTDSASALPAPTGAAPTGVLAPVPRPDELEQPSPTPSSPRRGEAARVAPTGGGPPEEKAGSSWQDPPADRRPASGAPRGVAPRDRPPGTSRTDGERTLAFYGPVFNETIGQGGRLRLSIRHQEAPGVVSVRFEASNGLIGSGELRGTLASDGRITVSGTLLMGRNPHECELTGVVSDDRLSGTATFRRGTSAGTTTRSTFRLTRS